MGHGWGAADVVAAHVTDGFTDPGEEIALAQVAPQCLGRVLDVGVGAGRTTGLLRDGAAAYVGIDVEPAMVERARARFPGADLRVGDARTLAGLPDDGFDLVLFSHNGLDALDHDGREQALRAMARVTAPDGRVVFSSLSLGGVSFDEKPWSLRGLRSGRALMNAAMAARHPVDWVRSVVAYRRGRRLAEDGPGWARRPLRAYGFRFVVHFATVASVVAMTRDAGLEPVTAVSDRGDVVDLAAPTTQADYVHYVCRPGSIYPSSST